MATKKQIMTSYLKDRWYKKTLIITNKRKCSYEYINSVEMTVCSGYIKNNDVGCTFDTVAWPFRCKTFDLIILDGAYLKQKKHSQNILSQLYFCLSDDGDVIIAGTKDIRPYALVSRFITSGFLTKKLELVSKSNNIISSIFKRIISKRFVAVFHKDKLFDISSVGVAEILNKTTSRTVYGGISAKHTCGDHYEKK
jgi:hypothetical protein